jgi:YHS domain-containing protein
MAEEATAEEEDTKAYVLCQLLGSRRKLGESLSTLALHIPQGNEMPRDPVCGLVLDEKTARFKIKHEGETYYFCTSVCKKRFKRNPDKFVK